MKLNQIRQSGASWQPEKVNGILLDAVTERISKSGGDVIAVHYVLSMPDTRTVNVNIVTMSTSSTGVDMKSFDAFENKHAMAHYVAEGALKMIRAHVRTAENPTTSRAGYALYVVEN